MTQFGIIEERGRIIERRKGHDDRDITANTIKITFEGARATGKSTLMNAVIDKLLPEARIVDPIGSRGSIDEHALYVQMTPEIMERLRT